MSESKICPFCKKEIPKNTAECIHCRRILIERINTISQIPKLHHKEKINYPQKIKEDISRQLNNIKSKGILIAVIIFLFLILRSNNNNSLPMDEGKNYNRLAHGTIINSSSYYLIGLGEITIENGTERDAVIKLVNNLIDKSIFTVYISSKNTYTIRNISDGRYRLFFNTGEGWDSIANKFKIHPNYLKFKEDFNFFTKEMEYYNGIETKYSIFKVTLHPVVGGTAKTDNTTEMEFAKY